MHTDKNEHEQPMNTASMHTIDSYRSIGMVHINSKMLLNICFHQYQFEMVILERANDFNENVTAQHGTIGTTCK